MPANPDFAENVAFFILLTVGYLAGMWGCFSKAGYSGFWGVIPIVNWIVLLKILDINRWWILVLLLPGINVIALFVWHMFLIRGCGHKGFWLWVLFLLFGSFVLLVVGFSSRPYDTMAATRFKNNALRFWLNVAARCILWEMAKDPQTTRYWYLRKHNFK